MVDILVKGVVRFFLPRRHTGRATGRKPIEAGLGLLELSLVSGGDRRGRAELEILSLRAPGVTARAAEVGMFARDV